jgi:alkylhydroperoxidase/carboxymuconolactone decarboxylase family protein YurZ
LAGDNKGILGLRGRWLFLTPDSQLALHEPPDKEKEKNMTLPNPGSWQAILEKEAPQLFEDVSAVRDHVLADGALSQKVKVLMTMLCDALLAHPEGVANIANRARAAGATEEEIAETVGVAFVMGGTPALVTGANAFNR